MKVGVIGCAHGELELMYDTLTSIEKEKKLKVAFLICCGDFQAVRNENDLQCMATKLDKIGSMGSFYKYYSGEKIAPVLTIFIGGNHEASNYLQELPFGGWVAPNIYYLGNAGCVNVGGIRIAGISGIYKKYDYLKNRFESPPYSKSSIRSVYHIRQLEVFRLMQLSNEIDIGLSHDWPQNIDKFGDFNRLLEIKLDFRKDIESNRLGSPPTKMILQQIKPVHWFSAHMHTFFTAVVPHENSTKTTKFIALDRCGSEDRFVNTERKFLEIVQIKIDDEQQSVQLSYDLEWLTILHLTQHLSNSKINATCSLTPTKENMELVLERFDNNLIIPMNFCRTVDPYDPLSKLRFPRQQKLESNPQTATFCTRLGIEYPFPGH